MNPLYSVGIYLIWQFVVFLLLRRCTFYGRFNGLHVVGILLFAALTILPLAGAFLPDSDLKYRLQGAGNIWLGFVIYFSVFLIGLSLLGKIVLLIQGKSAGRLHLTGIFLVSMVCSLGLLAYGMIHAQDTIVTELDVPVNKSAGDRTDLDIVLIADLHLSVNSHLSTIEKMVDRINGAEPDAVVIAGDIFTSSYEGLRDPDKYAAALRKLKTKEGVYAVYGNHDVEETLFGGFPISPISEAFRTRQMEQFCEDCGFTVLYDETVAIADGNVQIAGRIDGEKAGDGTTNRKTAEELLRDTDPEKPVIVLQHEPTEFAELEKYGADLALCGHTHAGQFFPGNLIVPFFNENAYGYKNVSGLDTIVTSGIGYYGPPMRVGTDSEIMILHLHFKDAGDR